MTAPTICATLKIALDRRATSRHDNAHGAMTEENFPFAAEAKQAIAKSGYFLVGTDAIETIGHAPVA